MSTGIRLTIAAAVATFLGALPLSGGFEDLGWLRATIGAIAAVLIVGLLLRWARAPEFLVPLLQVGGLLSFFALMYAADESLLGFIPTSGTFDALRETLRAGLDDAQQLSAPVATDTKIVPLTGLAVGAVAIVVDLVAVTLRRPAVAGLALLAMYAVAATVSDGVSWLGFVPAGCGFLVLLSAEGRDRLAAWGRPISSSGMRAPRPASLARISVAALAIAVVVPVVVPGLSTNLLTDIGGGSGDGSSHEGRTGDSIDPFTHLRAELTDGEERDLLRLEPDNGVTPYHLRTSVLDAYTGEGWQRGNISTRPEPEDVDSELTVPSELTQQVGSGNAREVRAKVTIENYDSRQLPILYAPREVNVDGNWTYDPDRSEVDGEDSTEDGLSYTMTSIEPRPALSTLEQITERLQIGPTGRWVDLPPTLPDRITTITQQAVAGAQTPFGQARALLNYFTDGTQGFFYAYETKAGTSGDALLDFLDNKQGFCEQYASAMAVMLRTLGIPSRVVLGYTVSRMAENGDGTYTITNRDAHAWVEAKFADVGWVPFDPTPLSDGRNQPPSYENTAPPDGSSSTEVPTTGPTETAGPNGPNNEPTTPPAGGGVDNTNGGSGGVSATTRNIAAPLIGLSVVAIILLPLFLRVSARRRRLQEAGGSDPVRAAAAAWGDLVATLVDSGRAIAPQESPRATARRLIAALKLGPSAESGLRLIALAEERRRYAADATVAGDLPTAVRAVRGGLLGLHSRRRRLAIWLLPRSLTTSVAARVRNGMQQGRVRVRTSVRGLFRWRRKAQT